MSAISEIWRPGAAAGAAVCWEGWCADDGTLGAAVAACCCCCCSWWGGGGGGSCCWCRGGGGGCWGGAGAGGGAARGGCGVCCFAPPATATFVLPASPHLAALNDTSPPPSGTRTTLLFPGSQSGGPCCLITRNLNSSGCPGSSCTAASHTWPSDHFKRSASAGDQVPSSLTLPTTRTESPNATGSVIEKRTVVAVAAAAAAGAPVAGRLEKGVHVSTTAVPASVAAHARVRARRAPSAAALGAACISRCSTTTGCGRSCTIGALPYALCVQFAVAGKAERGLICPGVAAHHGLTPG